MRRHIATALVLSSSIVVASDLQDDREPPRHQRTDPSVDAPEIVVATIAQASAAAVATDRHGNTYITGTTSRPDFPTTPDALKRVWDPAPVQNFCFTDAILVKLSAADRVVYATRFGGSDNDIGNAVAVDAAGNIFIAGTTWSADFPSRGAFMSARHAQQGSLRSSRRAANCCLRRRCRPRG
jgi:hypothetical protein